MVWAYLGLERRALRGTLLRERDSGALYDLHETYDSVNFASNWLVSHLDRLRPSLSVDLLHVVWWWMLSKRSLLPA